MAVIIEKGIPIPVRVRIEKKPREPKYPFHVMEVGDSFIVANRGAAAAASSYAKKHPEVKFRSHKYPEGFRIWRIA